MNKYVITVVGKDTVGIIAKVCTYLAKEKVNILDISQTITGGYFNMMMIVDGSSISDMTKFKQGLDEVEKDIACAIYFQHEDIFNMMHRI